MSIKKLLAIVGLSSIVVAGGLVVHKTGQDKKANQEAYERRVEMFEGGVGLPYWYHSNSGMYSGFIRDQREIYKQICIDGRYNPEFDSKYVGKEEAERLLECYGHKKKK